MVALDYITAVNPPCAADLNVSIYIGLATNTMSPAYYRRTVDNSQWAIALKAMHIWTLAQRPLAEAGAITNESSGQEAISYVVSALEKGVGSTDGDLRSTQWGVQLIKLKKGQGPIMGVVCAPPSLGDYYSPFDLTNIALQLVDYD